MNSGVYKRYLVSVLGVILAFSFVDRLALGLVLQDIKVDLDLSDTQLGMLTGIAFALFYSIMGIPIARWADRGNRVVIISLTTALWSIAVAMCGMASNFFQLLMIRIGVAVGEAGAVPPAHSLIPDYFSREERPRAVAIYALWGSSSSVIGLFVAGWLNQIYGWRSLFVLIGLPGLALACLAYFTLREPRLERIERHVQQEAQPSLAEVGVSLWKMRTYRHLLLAISVVYFFGYGITQWQPAFFVRRYGMGTGELGTWLAAIYGLGGMIGTYWGGAWAARYAAGNERLQFKVMGGIQAGFAVISALIYVSVDKYVAFGLTALCAVAGATVGAPLFAAIQTLVPSQMRATSIALVYLVANLIGLGLGPLAAGALSDAFRHAHGEDSLRYALLVFSPGYLWAAWHLWRAARTIAGDLER